GGELAPGASSGIRSVEFHTPRQTHFTYDLVVLGQLNQAPVFTTAPDVEALAGHPYTYTPAATDPDGDTPAFTLDAGPADRTIDPATGRLTWNPTAEDAGNHALVLRVADGKGGGSEQRFTLTVRDGVPNRPPVFISTPAVDARINSAYTYLP